MAEGVFLHLARERGLGKHFVVDSAGTGNWHQGERPDHRTLAAASRKGVEIPGLARQITSEDFEKFDVIICMDEKNRRDVLALGADPDKVKLLLAYDPKAAHPGVPDPYNDPPEAFDPIFDMVHQACRHLLEELAGEITSARSPG